MFVSKTSSFVKDDIRSTTNEGLTSIEAAKREQLKITFMGVEAGMDAGS